MSTQNILCLHGALGTMEQFSGLLTRLSGDFHAFAFNFDGHGGTDPDVEFSIDRFADNAMNFIHDHCIEGCDVFGYSMGGYVALRLALENAGLVRKIVTLGTKFDWSPESAAKEISMLNPEIIEQKIPQFANELKRRHAPADWKKVVRQTACLLNGLGNGKAFSNSELSSIENDVCIAVGSKDKMVSKIESEKAASRLRNGKLIILEDQQHPIEQCDENKIIMLLNAFLK